MTNTSDTLPLEAAPKPPVQTACDIIIVGGGLAGLALSIQLARKNYKVIVFEKEQYPFHRVCGEYISLESWDFLLELGVPLSKMNVSHICNLQLTLSNGSILENKLPLGGFGISRFLLDSTMAEIARNSGVILHEKTKVDNVLFDTSVFNVSAQGRTYQSQVVCGSFGKRSNIDVRWKRPFILNKKGKLSNYIGVKYHVAVDFLPDTISLHFFPGGYCGIVRIEKNKYCLCYLTTADNLAKCHGSIQAMEQNILSKNPFLKKIFATAENLFDQPVSISQISFDRKSKVENHVLLAGDAAGMITPLCGNGMSMALHGSKIMAAQVDMFLKGAIPRDRMEKQYTRLWEQNFSGRLKAGRTIQRIFDNRWLIQSLMYLGKKWPRFSFYLIGRTHGKPF